MRCIALVLLLGLGCAPSYHRASAYRLDHAAGAHLEARATVECKARLDTLPGPPPMPAERFRTDGCSLWPDAMFTGESWQSCCVEHDIAYWCGGTVEMREKVDEMLRQCVATHYHAWMGAVMKPGVRLGGAPCVPAYWRWGYGHKYPAGYFEPAE
jgi:hypothetical protein